MDFIIPAILALIIWLYVSSKSGSSVQKSDAVRLTQIVTKLSIERTMEVIIEFANHNQYAIDTIDKENLRIVLNESAFLLSYGYFYPIQFTSRSDGQTLIEVGIRGKMSKKGLDITKSHERCVNGIRSYLAAIQ